MTNAKTRIAIVTGSSRGIGAAVAQRLASSGHIVYASMRVTSGHDAQQVAEMLCETAQMRR
jgi:NAD(P)-dependent dehydrogenase (short-subunit alcohol dehydrogenase family)